MTRPTTFAYEALRSDGTRMRGRLDARDARAAVEALGQQGLYPIDVAVARDRTTKGRSVSPEDLGLGFTALATLLSAGLSIHRVLELAGELVPSSWGDAVDVLSASVEEGHSLAHGLERSGVHIPGHLLAVIEAGEGAGDTGSACAQVARMCEDEASRRAAFWAAVSYPLILAAVSLASAVFLIAGVFPRFAELLSEGDRPLPMGMVILMGVGSTAEALAPVITLTSVVAGLLWVAWTRSDAGRLQWEGWLLTVPVLGRIRLATTTARAADSLAALLEAGLPLPEAITVAAKATGNRWAAHRMAGVTSSLAEGMSLATALQHSGAMSSTAVRLIRAGEEAGEVASMLRHAARVEALNALRRVRAMLRIVEPIAVLAIGALVLGVATALLQAMYGLRP